MKIALVVDDFHGGAGNIAQLLATELHKTHEVTMILTNLHSAKRYPLEGIRVVDLPMSINGGNKLGGLLSSIKKMKRALNAELKPDLIISFLDNNNSLVCLSQWWHKRPIIVSERSNPLAVFPNPAWVHIRRVAYRRANVVTVQFDVFRSFEKGRFEKKCMVTSNVVETPAKRKETWANDGVIRFATFGRLATIKRTSLAIKLFGKAHKQNPNMEFHIFGDGPNRERLEELIREQGLTDCVFLRGYCNDVHGTMVDFDGYLMASSQEGFPNALSEAMALGRPTVSFRCHDGIRQMTEDGQAGFVLEEGDRDGYVEKILCIARDAELRKAMGQRAMHITERYSMDKIMEQWMACIKEAMGQ